MANIDNNTTALQELLAKVNALPEAGSGGGGSGGGASVETCNLEVYNNTDDLISVWATTYDEYDGFIECLMDLDYHSSDAICGVVRGSVVTVVDGYVNEWVCDSEGAIVLSGLMGVVRCFVIENTASASITIHSGGGGGGGSVPEPI